jgi:hypothetical protein
MILLSNENIALLSDISDLDSERAYGNGFVAPMFNTSNSKLLDVEPPTPFVPNAWQWDEATQTWLEYDSAAIEAVRNPPPPPVVIPQSITPRQARLKLLEADLLDNLEAVITTNRAWQIEWEYATEVKRDSPLIDAVATQAGLTSEQIDQMFIEASQL